MQFHSITGPLLLGVGLFFVGATMVSGHLKKMANRRIRQLFSRFTRNDLRSSVLGLATGLITQSPSVSAFITAGLISSGLMTVRNALPIIFWSNAGASSLVIVAVMDITYLIEILIFVSGVCFAFEKPKRYHNLAGALFGVGLLFYGLQLIRTGAAPLASMPWVHDLMSGVAGSDILVMLIGAFLTIVTQTTLGICLIAITMAKAGVFSPDQAILIIFGIHMGSSVVTWLLSSNAKGTAKQMIMGQALFNLTGLPIVLALFYIERYTGVPLIRALLNSMSHDLETQMAYLIVMFNVFVPLMMLAFYTPFERLLARLWPPTAEEDLAKVKYIHEHSLTVPDIALDMVKLEQARLFRRLAGYTSDMRQILAGGVPEVPIDVRHRAFESLTGEIRAVLIDLAGSDIAMPTGKRLLSSQERLEQIQGAESCLYAICEEVRKAGQTSGLRDSISIIVESLDFILMTGLDALGTEDPDDLVMLQSMTGDRSASMKKMRERYMEAESGMEQAERSILQAVTGQFERAVWSLNRLAKIIVTEK